MSICQLTEIVLEFLARVITKEYVRHVFPHNSLYRAGVFCSVNHLSGGRVMPITSSQRNAPEEDDSRIYQRELESHWYLF